MQNSRIHLASPTIHGDELRFVKEAFDTNWISSVGANIEAFHREMAQYVGAKAAAALSSGTAALHLAVKLADVRRGDVVFCSDLTFAASANPIVYEGGVPVFIDSERDTWNMDPVALERAFHKYPNCRCVVVVNLYGTPAKLDEIRAICDDAGAVLIEDAAESLSATYKGRQTGTFGHYGAISFNGNKIITASGGGMLISDDEEAVKKARFWSTQSKEPCLWYEHRETGYNYRMNNVDAGIGRGQLLHLDEHRRLKKRLYEAYKAAFSRVDAIEMNPYLPCSEPNFWLSCILTDGEKSGVRPPDILAALDANNIEARPIWKPMHLQPMFKKCDFISAKGDVAADLFKRGLCLPSDIKMTDADIQRVVDTIVGMFV